MFEILNNTMFGILGSLTLVFVILCFSLAKNKHIENDTESLKVFQQGKYK